MSKLRPVPLILVFAATLTASLLLTPIAAEQTADDTSFRVGVVLDLSGQTSEFGLSTLNGVRLAADELNAKGGVGGRKITLVVRDDEGQPAAAATVTAGLIRRDKVHALLGEVASTNTVAAAQVAQRESIPLVTPAAAHPRVTETGDYIFRVCFADPFQGEFMARFASGTLKARRAAIIFDDGSDYSRGLAEAFGRKFGALGGRVVSTQTYAQTDTDFAAQLVAVRAASPDVVFVPGYYNEAAIIARQAKRMGAGLRLLGADGWDAPQLWDLGGAALDGSYISNHYSVEDPLPANQKFIAAYKARHGRAPDSLAALGYDALGLLADAVLRAGTSDAPKLRDAIARTKNYAGATGAVTLDARRDAVKPGRVFKLQNRKFVYAETVTPD